MSYLKNILSARFVFCPINLSTTQVCIFWLAAYFLYGGMGGGVWGGGVKKNKSNQNLHLNIPSRAHI